jgi:hypothetical protein
MNDNAIFPKSSTPKEFRGFTIQLRSQLRESNAQMIAAALEKGRCHRSSKDVLKRKGNLEFLSENDIKKCTQKFYESFLAVWGEFSLTQIQNIDYEVLRRLVQPKYRELVNQLKDVAIITQQLVDSLLKELFPKKPKTPKEVSGWKQGAKGRYYNVALHDEETGMAVEAIAEKEKISRQKVIATAITLLKEQRAKILNFNPVAELERYKEQGKISDYADSEGIWLITLNDGHEIEPVTPNGLAMFLRRLENAA